VGRDQNRAMACVGLVLGKMRGQQSEPLCFFMGNGNEKKEMKSVRILVPDFTRTLVPEVITYKMMNF
jgi:hypothetical protein